MGTNGDTDRTDGVFGEGTEMAEKIRTLSITERFFILENIRYHGTQEDHHRARRQRYEQMIRHNDAVVAASNSLEPTKITEEK